VGLLTLLALLTSVRAVASVRARKLLVSQLAASTADVARLGTPRAKLVLPAFDGNPEVSGDCPAAQLAVSGRTPTLSRKVSENAAWQWPNDEQLEFAAAHAAEIAAFGQAATQCDRVRPAAELGGSAWQQPLEMYRRAKVLVIAGRASAVRGDVDTAVLRFLQSRRLGFEVGLDGSMVESIVGASAICEAEDALARLVSLGLPAALRSHIDRELAALEPFTPDLANSVRLEHAERASLIAGGLLELPFLTDVISTAARSELWGATFKQRVGALVLPPSAHAAICLTFGQAETDRALRDFTRLDAPPVDPDAAQLPGSAAWSVYALTLFPIAANRARDARFHLLARSALLRAALGLARAGDAAGKYPAAPALPLDPLAPGQPLGYALYPDGRYVLGSAGMRMEPKDAWAISSGRGTLEPAPPG
jgi:hypothetical protein